MIYRSLLLAATTLMIGFVGCTHNGGGMSAPMAGPTTTLSEDGMTKEQLQTKAEDEMREGNDLLAKGTADGNAEDKTKGQQLLDDAQKLLDEAKNLAPSN